LAAFKELRNVVEVRGLGMMAGIELNIPVKQVVADLLDEKIVTLGAGHNTLRLLPPLTISESQLTTALQKLSSYFRNKLLTRYSNVDIL
jgi:acetylornithine aminotransferase apoenzyme (EC 2.6.1.11)